MKLWKRVAAALFSLVLLTQSAAALPKSLIPGGSTIGMKAYTDGLVICEVLPDSPAEESGLLTGDILVDADGQPVTDAASFMEQMQNSNTVELTYLRHGEKRMVEVRPRLFENQMCIGVKLRDSIAGIGTVTYYDPDTGTFGALGHGITDMDGTSLIPIRGGVVVPSAVSSVSFGSRGTAGQLQGEFDTTRTIGAIIENTEFGVFGKMEAPSEKSLAVALPGEIKTGKATILANVEGTQVAEYEIEILHIYADAENQSRNMLLRVVDPVLLKKTGGIVQGMSGSPILQNGKLVGAVTHVLLNAPNMGYGIFLETMLSHTETVHSQNAPFFLLTKKINVIP